MAAAAGTLTVLAATEVVEDRLSRDTCLQTSEAAGRKGAGSEAGMGSLKCCAFPRGTRPTVCEMGAGGNVERIPRKLGCMPLRW